MPAYGAERSRVAERMREKRLQTVVYTPPMAEDNKTDEHVVHHDYGRHHPMEEYRFGSGIEALKHLAPHFGVSHRQLSGLELPGKSQENVPSGEGLQSERE